MHVPSIALIVAVVTMNRVPFRTGLNKQLAFMTTMVTLALLLLSAFALHLSDKGEKNSPIFSVLASKHIRKTILSKIVYHKWRRNCLRSNKLNRTKLNEAKKPDKRNDYFLDVDKWENIFLVRAIMLALAWGLLTGALICLILALNEIC